MRIKRFNEEISIYQVDWEKMMPKSLTINQRGKQVTYKLGEITKNYDMVQCPYINEEIWGFPETLEFDHYFDDDDNDGKIKIMVDITLGDAMVCEFSMEPPNKIVVGEYTSYRSKTDPSDTVFGFSNNSLQELISFWNQFKFFHLTVDDFKFLDLYDDFQPK